MDYFSRALSYEVRNSGVTVQTLIPFYVATNLTKFSDFIGRPSVLVPNAQAFVRSALSTLGICDRTTGYWSHELQVSYYLYFAILITIRLLIIFLKNFNSCFPAP